MAIREVPYQLFDFIRSHREMYLGIRPANGVTLSVSLAEESLRLGEPIATVRVVTDWYIVASARDWITPSMSDIRGEPWRDAFYGFRALNLDQPNEVRFEPILAAFSSALCIWSARHLTPLFGSDPGPEVLDTLDEIAFAVLFQPSSLKA
jgi:hypothetical protein